jgi:hypothetical protein
MQEKAGRFTRNLTGGPSGGSGSVFTDTGRFITDTRIQGFWIARD